MLPDDWLISNVRSILQSEIESRRLDGFIDQAWIDSGYKSGKPRVRFAGEGSPGLKQYPYLSSYQPAPNDHVLLVRLGKTFIIVGKIL